MTTTPGEVPIHIEGAQALEKGPPPVAPAPRMAPGEVAIPIEGATAAQTAPTGMPVQAGGPVEHGIAKPGEDVDAITLLLADHRNVLSLYDQSMQATDQDTKLRLSHDFIREMCLHTHIEERILYPALRDRLQPDGKALAEKAFQEHLGIERQLEQLEVWNTVVKMRENEAEYNTLMGNIVHDFKAHAQDEETNLFPKMQAQWDQQYLLNLGRKLRKARKTAPTRPHPKLPKEGMMARMGGAVAGVYDRVADRITKSG